MPTTPIYALRYPASSDPADVPLDMSELATDVETKLGGAPITSLPGSPVDGQIVRYKVAANGPVWTLQYLAASAAPYRWHFLGGAAMAAGVDTDEPIVAVGSWTNPATVGPTVTAPLAGEYFCEVLARIYCPAAGIMETAPQVGAAAVVEAHRATVHSNSGASVVSTVARNLVTATAAATAVAQRYKQSGAGASYSNRRITLTPVRVG